MENYHKLVADVTRNDEFNRLQYEMACGCLLIKLNTLRILGSLVTFGRPMSDITFIKRPEIFQK
jgi:hypothetical protein